jgi:hypothetical protein
VSFGMSSESLGNKRRSSTPDVTNRDTPDPHAENTSAEIEPFQSWLPRIKSYRRESQESSKFLRKFAGLFLSHLSVSYVCSVTYGAVPSTEHYARLARLFSASISCLIGLLLTCFMISLRIALIGNVYSATKASAF